MLLVSHIRASCLFVCLFVVVPRLHRELALESGIKKWGRVPALNTNQRFIDDLADAVVSEGSRRAGRGQRRKTAAAAAADCRGA